MPLKFILVNIIIFKVDSEVGIMWKKNPSHYLIINYNSQTFFPYYPKVIMRGAAIRPRNQKEHQQWQDSKFWDSRCRVESMKHCSDISLYFQGRKFLKN